MFILFYILSLLSTFMQYMKNIDGSILLGFPTPEDLSMAITNSCAARGEAPRTNNQSKHIHYNTPGDRVYRQTTTFQKIILPLSNNPWISYYGLLECSFFFLFQTMWPIDKILENWTYQFSMFFLFSSIFFSTLLSNSW